MVKSLWITPVLTLKKSKEKSNNNQLLVQTRENASWPIYLITTLLRFLVRLGEESSWLVRKNLKRAKITQKLRVSRWEGPSTKTDTPWQKWARTSRSQLAQSVSTKQLRKHKLRWTDAHIFTAMIASKPGPKIAKTHVRSAKPRSSKSKERIPTATKSLKMCLIWDRDNQISTISGVRLVMSKSWRVTSYLALTTQIRLLSVTSVSK